MIDKKNRLCVFILLCNISFQALGETKASLARVIAPFSKQVPFEVEYTNNTSSEISVKQELGFIFVDVFINLQGPFRFLVDTGADVSILSYDLIKKLNILPVESTKRIFQTAQKKAEVDTYLFILEQFKLGDIVFKKAPFIASNTASDDFQLLQQMNIIGVIGTNIFHDLILTLDLGKNKMILSQPPRKKMKNENVLSLEKSYYSPVINTTVTKGKQKTSYHFLIDSGYTGFAKMPICFDYHPEHKKDDIVTFDVFNDAQGGFLSELDGNWEIGKQKIDNPLVKYNIGACEAPPKWGLIGTQFLQHHIITLDQTNRELILQALP